MPGGPSGSASPQRRRWSFRWLTGQERGTRTYRRSPPCFDRWLLLQLTLALGTGPAAVGELDVRHHLLAGGAAGGWMAAVGELAPRPMGPCAERQRSADRLVADSAARAPLAPPCGSYRTTRSVYSSYRATVNAAFEGLLPYPGEVEHTGALRSIKNRTWKAGLAPYPCWWPRQARTTLSLAAVPCTCPKQRVPAVANGQQRSVAVAPDLRQRRMAASLTVLPKLAVARAGP